MDPVARLGELRLLPVVEVPGADAGLRLAAALADAGLPAIEVTLRTPAALEAIRRIAAELPEVLVGAGTILTIEQLHQAAEAGARFGVSPGFDRALVDEARTAALPYLPGIATASELQAALAAGRTTVKFFPAEASGGLPALQALAAPFGPAGARFVPTGGIRADSAAAYLADPHVLAVGGTWLTPRTDVEAGAWDRVRARTRAAVEALRS